MSETHPGEELLIALALDELEPPTRARAERHLAQCPSCRTQAETLRRVLDAARSVSPTAPPTSVLVELVSAQQAGRRRPATLTGRRVATGALARRALPVAVTLALVFMVGFWIGSRSGERSPSREPVTPVALAGGEAASPRSVPPGDLVIARPLPLPPVMAFHAVSPLEAGVPGKERTARPAPGPEREERDSL